MKTKMILLLLAAMTTLLACNKDDDGVDPNDPDAMRTIKLTMEASGHIDFEFEEYYTYDESWDWDVSFPADLSIDWGDGSVTSSNSHKYNTSGTYNVTIQAKNLKLFEYDGGWLDNIHAIDLKDCNSLIVLALQKNIGLRTLDVTNMKVLECLDCSGNYLTSLDIKSCSSLRELDCSRNELSAETLNKIFNDLPQGKTWTEYGYKYQSSIDFYGNPGSKDCDISILEKKG